jgi:hypothetical protein
VSDGERDDEDSEAIRARRDELVRESLRDRLRPRAPVARPEATPTREAKPAPCLSMPERHAIEGRSNPSPPQHLPREARRSGSRPWVWIAGCVFVASVLLALVAVWLLDLA